MMTLAQAHALLPGATLVGDGATRVLRVHSDTRSLQPGDLFVALKGERFDALNLGRAIADEHRARQQRVGLCERHHVDALPRWASAAAASSRSEKWCFTPLIS